MDRLRWTLPYLVALLALASCDEPARSGKGLRPRIDRIDPACGWEAGWDEIRIYTSHFKDDFLIHLPEVTFGPWPAQDVIPLGPTAVIAVTPDGMTAGFVDVEVTSTGVPQTAVCPGCFEVTPGVAVCCSELFPVASPLAGGQLITLRGGPFEVGTYVSMGGGPAPNQQLDLTRTIITFETPPSPVEMAADLSLITPSGSSFTLQNAIQYVGDGYCTDVRVDPPAADVAGGGTVRLSGVEFDHGPAGTPTVEFGTPGNWVASPLVINLQDGSTLLAEVPPWHGTEMVRVQVTNGSTGYSCSSSFRFVEAPDCALFRVEPDRGPICEGNLVILKGIHLDPAPQEVWFGSLPVDVTDPGEFLWVDSGTVQVRVPAFAGTWDVTYVNPGPVPCSSTVTYHWR